MNIYTRWVDAQRVDTTMSWWEGWIDHELVHDELP